MKKKQKYEEDLETKQETNNIITNPKMPQGHIEKELSF